MRSIRAAGGALLALMASAGVALAVPGYVVEGINMRAGPGVDYPWVAALPPGTETEIFGCLPGYTWCDVAAVGTRGWVAGVGLQLLYGQQPEPLVDYGPQIGLPFVGFDFHTYWGSYYRNRPWYSGVDRWHGGPPGRGFGPGRDYGPGPGYRIGGNIGPGPGRGGPEFDRGPGPGLGRDFGRPGGGGPGRGGPVEAQGAPGGPGGGPHAPPGHEPGGRDDHRPD